MSPNAVTFTSAVTSYPRVNRPETQAPNLYPDRQQLRFVSGTTVKFPTAVNSVTFNSSIKLTVSLTVPARRDDSVRAANVEVINPERTTPASAPAAFNPQRFSDESEFSSSFPIYT